MSLLTVRLRTRPDQAAAVVEQITPLFTAIHTAAPKELRYPTPRACTVLGRYEA